MLAETIFSLVFQEAMKALAHRDVPVAPKDAEAVAAAVTQKVAPVLVNATNAEPWWRSRVYLGLIVAGIGIVGAKFGLVIPGDAINQIVDFIMLVMQVVGVAYALYGRIVGASKKPLGTR